MKIAACALWVLIALAGCKKGCSPGVQEGQSNPLEGERPGICEGKRD